MSVIRTIKKEMLRHQPLRGSRWWNKHRNLDVAETKLFTVVTKKKSS